MADDSANLWCCYRYLYILLVLWPKALVVIGLNHHKTCKALVEHFFLADKIYRPHHRHMDWTGRTRDTEIMMTFNLSRFCTSFLVGWWKVEAEYLKRRYTQAQVKWTIMEIIMTFNHSRDSGPRSVDWLMREVGNGMPEEADIGKKGCINMWVFKALSLNGSV